MASWAVLRHSAKGSEWEKHKYVKRENGNYYYPNGYPGGRHIENAPGEKNSEDKKEFDSSEVTKSAKTDEKTIQELYELGAKKGYDSKEYLDRLYELSGKDANRAKEITEAIGVGLGHKKPSEKKKDKKEFSSEEVAKAAKTDKKNIDALYKVGSTKGFDSKEYLSKLYEISGKDTKRAKEITEAVGVGLGHKKSTSTKTSKEADSKKSASSIAKSTGSDEKSVKRAMSVGAKKGYDSKEYLEELKKASGGDAEQAKKITESIGESLGHKKKKEIKHMYVVSDKYLAHHGIKNMRWGLRRFQNKDGSLTSAGRLRYLKGDRRSLTSDDYKKGEEVASQTSKGLKSASSAINSISVLHNKKRQKEIDKAKAKAKQNIDLSNMSDKELQQKLNRMNMERQYKEMTAHVDAGRDYVGDTLETVGAVVTIGASAATMVATILAIKKITG